MHETNALKSDQPPSIGVVVIGRNEGDRLRLALDSVLGQGYPVVYVDSGSTDGSVAQAHKFGVNVVELDPSTPFTAARARNTGLDRLLEIQPDMRYVQFVDGDCTLASGWIEAATRVLESRPDVAIVTGRLRERYPEASVYSRLCDMEWDTPIGELQTCGGIFVIRADVFRQVDGFNIRIIAGEEPDLCIRLREQQWKILRIDRDMGCHDAGITRFGQWWSRARRAGHAYAEGAWLHRRSNERPFIRQIGSIIFWAGILPLAALLPAGLTNGLSLALLFAYPIQMVRIWRSQHRLCGGNKRAMIYAVFAVMAKFAQLSGIMLYLVNGLRRRKTQIIEYKNRSATLPRAGEA